VARLNKVLWMSILGLLVFGFLGEAKESMESRVRRVSAYYVAHYAALYRVPVTLVEAVIEVESAWRLDAISDKGACGLMQLMPTTARRLMVSNPFNIEQNIRAGTQYLGYLSQLFNGDVRLVLAAKHSHQLYFLQIADSAAVDRPSLMHIDLRQSLPLKEDQ
jgi:hypothetical protein